MEHCDYLTNKNYKTVKRRRADPLITFASYLEKVVGDLRQMDEALQFLQPVNPKKVPDYLEKIHRYYMIVICTCLFLKGSFYALFHADRVCVLQ